MGLPLPYVVVPTADGVDAEAVQANFDSIKKSFPLSRKHMQIETPHTVGAAGEPSFVGAWVDFDTTIYPGLRFWKDPMGIVYVQGVIKSGALNTTAFVLPAGYRPRLGVPPFAADTNSGHGRVDVAPTGDVIPKSGGTTYFAINIWFKQES